MYKSTLSFTIAVFVAFSAHSTSYNKNTKILSCSEMGYKKSINCTGDYLSCPFDTSYKVCIPDCCEKGYSTTTPNLASCGTGLGWSWSHDKTSGTQVCGKCECSAPSGCVWTNTNKGNATITDICCNGNYKTCTSHCKEITIPSNATGSTKCTACGKEVYTDFECNAGYSKVDGNSFNGKMICERNTIIGGGGIEIGGGGVGELSSTCCKNGYKAYVKKGNFDGSDKCYCDNPPSTAKMCTKITGDACTNYGKPTLQ